MMVQQKDQVKLREEQGVEIMQEEQDGVMVHGSLGAVEVLGKLIRCYNDGTSRGGCGDDAENFFLSGF